MTQLENELSLIFYVIFYSIDQDYEVLASSSQKRNLSSSDSDSDDHELQPKRGRPSIPFSKAVQRTKLKKTDDDVEYLTKRCNDLEVSYEVFLLFLLKRNAATNGDNEAMNYFNKLLKDGIPKESNTMDTEKAFYIK